jgi:hypothetical protein
MWWGILACAEPDPRLSELESRHEELQTELGTLDERVGRVTSGVGELETRVDIRLAEVEARMEQLRKDFDQRSVPRVTSAASWLGTWSVRAEPVSDLGCGDAPDPGDFRWQIGGQAQQMSVSIDGNTRYRALEGELEGGVLTATQSEGYDSSMVVVEQQGTPPTFTGFRVLTSVRSGRPCTLVWKLTGKRG